MSVHGDADDFIGVYPEAVPADVCAAIVARIRAAPDLKPGAVGGGVFPELKRSRDLGIDARADWADIKQQLNLAMLRGLRLYLRRWPQALIAPLMLQVAGDDGQPRRLAAEDFAGMDDGMLTALITRCFRPGAINLQWYDADTGGYPYWHCEHYPRDDGGDSLHRTLLWTLYLNDDFEAGETEFLFQQRKVAPRAGSLLIAPAGFTHTHRGNAPRARDKFIATSWILFQPAHALAAGN